VQRRLIGGGELLTGLFAGAATLLACILVLLVLGRIPWQATEGFFGVRYPSPPVPLTSWFSDAFLAPFWGETTVQQVEPHGALTFRSASFGALLVFSAILWLVGRLVRRRVPPTLRQRGGVLFVTALVVAAGVAVAAAALSFSFPSVELRPPEQGTFLGAQVTHDPLSYFLGAFATTLLVGAFCFGVVGTLPQPWAAALRRAGALLGVCLVAGGLLFPLFVISDDPLAPQIDEDFGRASQFSAAAGALVVPLALQAPVWLVQWSGMPWRRAEPSSEGEMVHWPELALSTGLTHPRGRLYEHAATLGVVGSLVGAALTLAVVGALVVVSWGLCRTTGPPTPRRGLLLGLLQGGVICGLLAVTVWLASYYARYGPPRPLDAGERGNATFWGITGLGLAQTVATILLVCGLTGLVYGVRQVRLSTRTSDVSGDPTALIEPGAGRAHAQQAHRADWPEA
jgi:hypothetical protein